MGAASPAPVASATEVDPGPGGPRPRRSRLRSASPPGAAWACRTSLLRLTTTTISSAPASSETANWVLKILL